ncbi:PAS domain S-box protein [Haloarcula sp. S1AR25-5A]|uniref:histidine kinase n=1 Tax=Haloarcula terrestris TaxID=2950533 RepID=A0AAE4JIY2_9EURY|nr:PAS domain S-box protein [Haloarcula terrestris]MDS0221674.1 PAS domain S-box protein [Haloarcula terrestris]
MNGPPDTIRVLHVDDEHDFADLTATFLEREDDRFTVETATSASAGTAQLEQRQFDCVVSDYDMPGQNGIAFLTSVREQYPDLPFILFTGKGSEEVASDAISAGVTDYLQKEGGTDQYAVLANRITNAVEHQRAQQRVERSEQRLREIVDALPHLLYVVDEDGDYLLANEALATFHDTTVADIEGSNIAAVLDAPAAEQFRQHIAEVLEAGTTKRIFELEIDDSDGQTHVFEPRLQPYKFGDVDNRAVLGIGADITERKTHERTLERTRERMQLALEHTNSVIFEIDCDTGEVVRHGAYSEFFDLSADEVLTWEDHLTRAVHPDDRDQFQQFYQQLVDGKRDSGQLEYRTTPEMGDVRWIRDTVSVKNDSDSGSRQALGIAREITEHKEREQELQRKERRYQAVFDDPNILVGLIDTDGTVLEINETAMDYVDATRADVTDEPFWETPWFNHSESLQEDVRGWIERAADGEYVAFETDLVQPSGEQYTVEGVFRPVRDADGDVVSLIISGREITEQKEYERELEQTNALLSTLFDTLPVGVLAEDEQRNVVAINEQMFELFDLPGSPDEIRGTDCAGLAADVSDVFADSEGFVDRIGDLIAGQEPVYNEEIELADGQTYARSYHPIDLSDGGGHLWVYRDITARKTRETRLATLNETMPELMAAETRTGVAEIGIEAAANVLGLEASAIHLYDEQDGLVPVAQTDAGNDLIGEPPTFTGEGSIAWRVYEQGEALATEDVHDNPDIYNPDSPVRSELILPLGEVGILIASSPTEATFDEEDRVLGEILASNITAALEQVERTAEIRAREAELERQNERLEEFASVVSHDLRNPLRVVEGRLELLKEDCETEQVAPIERALDRMDALIEDILTFAREGNRVSEMEAIDLREVCEACWQHVETAEATLEITTDKTIRADRSRLQQLIENLVRNAVEHGGEDVTVSVGDLETGFYVADDGPGISADERESVFDAGYSTADDGTGFGLSIVKQVADAHGWDITITESEAGGVRFEITGTEHA